MTASVLIDGRPAQGHPRGVGIYVQRLLPALLANKARTLGLKIALDRRRGEDPWPKLEGIEKVWGNGMNPAHWEQRILPRLAETSKASLLHATANSAPWRLTIPYVVSIHDAIFMRPLSEITGSIYARQFLSHLYYRYGVGYAAKRALKIITDSEYSKYEIVKKLRMDPEKIHIVRLANPHATSPLPEDKVKETIQAYALKRPYLLGFGAIDLRKNTANLVRAFARLPRSAAYSLVLAGFERAERSVVPTLIKHLGIKDRIKILDYIPDRDLTALFQGAAAFVYPTRVEGFGLPILQAFYLGVPVVTSRVGSVPEVAGKAVRFADPDDPRSISQEILAILIDSNEAHRLTLNGYLQVKQFSWETTAAETLEIYMTALRKKR
ncbi:glycosyltransferase family 4 protein [bacterium]|nr:glycosyltransferase family 4 protein [bacterium]